MSGGTLIKSWSSIRKETIVINPNIQRHLDRWPGTYMVSSQSVATVNVDNPLNHAFLVLTADRFSKIVVVDNDNRYRGQLSLAMINEKITSTDNIDLSLLDKLTVADAMEEDEAVTNDPDNFEYNYRLLMDRSFIPVVGSNGEFCGIVTRRKLMDALNYVMHTPE